MSEMDDMLLYVPPNRPLPIGYASLTMSPNDAGVLDQRPLAWADDKRKEIRRNGSDSFMMARKWRKLMIVEYVMNEPRASTSL